MIDGFCEYRVDPLGSLICFKKGLKTPEKKLMICAHMDEVGFIVTYIRSDGTLSFDCVGGIDPSVIIGRQVTVKSSITGEKLYGVVGSTAVHNLSKEQREKAPKTDSLYIGNTGLRVSQLLSIVLCLLALAALIILGRRPHDAAKLFVNRNLQKNEEDKTEGESEHGQL